MNASSFVFEPTSVHDCTQVLLSKAAAFFLFLSIDFLLVLVPLSVVGLFISFLCLLES